MPRATLPNITAKMRTMEVLITKTTEEAIWTHLQNKMVGLEEKVDMYSKRLNDITDMYFHNNPYEKYTIKDWREGRPKQKYKLEKMRWLTDMGDDYAEDFFRMLEIISDIRICNRAFPEWNERLRDIMEVVEFLKFDTDELIIYESRWFRESREKYEKEDAEWIEEKRKYNSHRDHITRENFMKNEYYRLHYGSEEPSYWTTCEWCVKHEQNQKEIKEYQQEEERKIQEDIKRYNEKRRQEQAQRIAELEYHTCDICDYRTSNEDAYDRHMDSKEHRVKQNHTEWFCKCCNTQSRSKNEHEFHLKSNKHQQNAGLAIQEVKVYTCECCEYETQRKDLYNRHLSSKKHITNSSK